MFSRQRSALLLSLFLSVLTVGLMVWLIARPPVSAAQQCTVSVTPIIAAITEAGGSQSLKITLPNNCPWTATIWGDAQGWVTIEGAATGTGSGQVTLKVEPNTTARPRYGTVAINDQPIKIGQQAAFNTCQVTAIQPGDTVRGQLTVSDCLRLVSNNSFAFSHADAYSFSGRAGDTVHAFIDPDGETSYLYGELLGPDGKALTLIWNNNNRLTAALPVSGIYSLLVATLAQPAPTNVAYRASLQINANGCNDLTLKAQDAYFPAAGSGRVLVSTASNCAWQAYSTAAWLTLNEKSGTGSRWLNFSVAENPTTTSRSALIKVGMQEVVIRQAGRGNQCGPQPLTPNQPVTGSVTPGDCVPPFAQAGVGDHYVFEGRAGQRLYIESSTNSGSSPNPRLSLYNSRGELMRVNDRYLPISPQERLLLPEDGVYSLVVSGYSMPFDYSVTVTLQPVGCVYTISTNRLVFPASGGRASVRLETQAHCPWQLLSAPTWATVDTGGSNNMGAATLTFTAAANTSSFARVAAGVVLGNQLFQMFQAGAGNNCAVTPLTAGVTITGRLDGNDCPSRVLPPVPSGGNPFVPADAFSFQGQAGQVFSFTVLDTNIVPNRVAPVSYALLDPAGKLIDSGDLNAALPPSFTLPLSGMYQLEIVSRTYWQGAYALTLTLGAGECHTYATASATRFEADGGSGTIQIEAPSNCPWRVQVLTNNSFKLDDPPSGSGRGQVRFSFPANAASAPVLATVQIGDQILRFAQAGRGGVCQPRLLPAEQFVTGQITAGNCPLEMNWGPANTPIQGEGGSRFYFNGQTGENIALLSLRQEQVSNPNPLPLFEAAEMKLYDPDGQWMNDAPATRIMGGRFRLPKTGVYSVTLSPILSIGPGQATNYQLLLERLTPGCLYDAESTIQRFDGVSGTGSLRVTTSSQCQWTPRSNTTWLTVTSPPGNQPASGSAEVRFSVAGPLNNQPRTATLVAGGQAIEIDQGGNNGRCGIQDLSMNQALRGVITANDCRTRTGQNQSDFFRFTTRNNEAIRLSLDAITASFYGFTILDANWRFLYGYSVLPTSPWLTLPSGTYYLQVQGYPGMGYTLNLNTAATPCQYTITQNERVFFSPGGTGTLSIRAGDGCDWMASSGNQNTLKILSGERGRGDGVISYQVEPFASSVAFREISIFVNQQRFTITQLSAQTPSSCDVQPLVFEQTKAGAITTFDCVSQFNQYPQNTRADRYSFTAQPGRQFAVEYSSSTGGAMQLTLYDANRRVVAQSQGLRLPLSSSQAPAYLVLPDSQTYYLEVSAPVQTGIYPYELKLVTATQCGYNFTRLSPAFDQPLPATGGIVTAQLVTGTNCPWKVLLPNWVTAAGATTGTGPTTFTFNIARNETAQNRRAEIQLDNVRLAVAVEQLGSGGVCTTRAIRAGEIVRGSVKYADCLIRPRIINGENWPPPSSVGQYPAHQFSFTAQLGDQLAIHPRLISTPINPIAPGINSPQLALLDPNGQVVTDAAYGPRIPWSYTNPQTTRIVLQQSGTYSLELYNVLGDYEFVLDLTPGGCNFVLETSDAQIATQGGAGTVQVHAASNCQWQAYAAESWITLTESNGSGNGVMRFTVAPNNQNQAVTRRGAIQLAGRSVPLVQAGAAGQCAPVPLSAGQSQAGELTNSDCRRLDNLHQLSAQPVDRYRVTARAGESIQVKVINNSSLGVQVIPLNSLRLTSTELGSYQPPRPTDWFGTASLLVPADGDYVIEVMPEGALANNQTIPYTIHLQINAPGCGVVLDETQRAFAATAGAGSVNVTAPSECRWETYAVNDWITVSGERTRVGRQNVAYTLAANPAPTARWGSVIVGGQILLIEQAGSADTATAAGTCVTATLNAGQTVYGQLSLADCRPQAALPQPATADRYRFTGTAGQRIQLIARTPEPLTLGLPVLTLFDGLGRVLGEFKGASSDSPPLARIPANSTFFTLPQDGEYTIEIAFQQPQFSTTPRSQDYALSLILAPAGCGYSVAASPLRFDAIGGMAAVNVTTNSGCAWTATPTDAWVVSQPATTQTGSGSVSVSVQPNQTNRGRRSVLLVAGRFLTIEQAAPDGQCSSRPLTVGATITSTLDEQDCPSTPPPPLSSSLSSPPRYAERYAFAAETNDRMLVTLTSLERDQRVPFNLRLRLTGPNGVQLLEAAALRLPDGHDRFLLPTTGAYELEISGTEKFSFTMTLLIGKASCHLALPSGFATFESTGGSGQLAITAGCAWQALSNAAWLTLNQASGSGNATLNFTVQPNGTTQARSTTITIGDQAYTVWQAGSGGTCATRTLVRNQLMQGRLGEGNCPDVRSPRFVERYVWQGRAGERINFTVQGLTLNPTLEVYDEQLRLIASILGKRLPERTGDLILPANGRYTLVIVSQIAGSYSLLAADGAACMFTVSPDSLTLPGIAGKREVFVTASQPSCSWSARVFPPWLDLPANAATQSGEAQLFTGSRALEISYQVNAGAPRLGALYVADHVITVQQDTRQLIPVAEPLACVNAASYRTGAQAPDSLIAAFGTRLATETKVAAQFTTSLAGTTVTVTDAAMIKREALVLFVSPTQVNFVMPSGLSVGLVNVEIISSDGYVTRNVINVAAVAPGLFSANANGAGLATGVVLRVKADQSQIYEPLIHYDEVTQRFVAVPITVNNPNETVYLVLFGTGLRGRSGLSAVTARSGNHSLEVQYCGSSDTRFLGLDQLNLVLPPALAGSGNSTLELTIDGKTANALNFNVR